MTSTRLDDAVSLRFHLARAMSSSLHLPEPRSPFSFLWRSMSGLFLMLALDALAMLLAFHGSAAGLPLVVLPKLVAWLLDRRHRRLEADFARSRLWNQAAYEIARHATRPAASGDDICIHGVDLIMAMNRIVRPPSGLLDPRAVVGMLALASSTTRRNRLLLLSSLQLSLLAHAEHLRVCTLHDGDQLDEYQLHAIRMRLRASSNGGRHPMSMDMIRNEGLEQKQ